MSNDKPVGSSIVRLFSTWSSDDPAASVAIAAFVLGDIQIYKNGGTTKRSSTSGIVLLDTDGIDFASQVGIGGYSIDLSDNADAGFYAADSSYSVVIGPVTIDSGVVNWVDQEFTIEIAGGAIALTKALVATVGVAGVGLTAVGLAADAITSDKIADGAFLAVNFGADFITAGSIADDSITSDQLSTSAAELIADTVWDELMSAHQVDGSFGLANNVIDAGTAQAGANGTITLDAGELASATADLLNGALITLVGGTGVGQTRRVTDYSTTTLIASVEPNWITNPASGTKYIVSAGGNANLRTATQTQFDEIETDTAEIGTAVGADISADIAALFTTAMTESYNADGSTATPAQALYMIMQALTEFAISGTTITVKKLDGSTTAYTGTLSDGTNPVSLTRAT